MDSNNPAQQAFTDELNKLLAKAKADPAFAAQKHFICYQVGELKSWIAVQIEKDGAFRFWHCNSMKRAAISHIKEAVGQFLWENQPPKKQSAWATIDKENFINNMVREKWFNEPILNRVHNAMHESGNLDFPKAMEEAANHLPSNLQTDEGVQSFLRKEMDNFAESRLNIAVDQGVEVKKTNLFWSLFRRKPENANTPSENRPTNVIRGRNG